MGGKEASNKVLYPIGRANGIMPTSSLPSCIQTSPPYEAEAVEEQVRIPNTFDVLVAM